MKIENTLKSNKNFKWEEFPNKDWAGIKAAKKKKKKAINFNC